MNQCPICKAEIFSSEIDRCPSCGQTIQSTESPEKSPNDTAETFVSDEFMTEDQTGFDNVQTIDDPSSVMGSQDDANSTSSEDSFSEDETYVADEIAERVDAPVEKTIAFDLDKIPDVIKDEAPESDVEVNETYQTVETDPESTLAEIDEEITGTVILDGEGQQISKESASEATVEIPASYQESDSADQTFILDDEDDDPMNSETFVTADSSDLADAMQSGDQTLDSDDYEKQGSSDDPDSFTETMISDHDLSGANDSGTIAWGLDANENELKTLQSNWDDKPGEKPEMTIKSRQDVITDEIASPRDTITSVPLRSLQSVNEKSSDRLKTPEYELLSILGEGGMGIVWSAKQTSVDRKVAVKMIKGNFSKKKGQRNKFLAEAIVTGDLDHPNIVPIYDVGTDKEGCLFYAMKQVQGTPWLKVIKEKSLHDNLEILLRVADAVAFAHARGIVHRDLKPENVMLGEFGEVLVMDWGLALPMKSFHNAERIRSISSMGGTPAYMSPEMATGPIDRITPQSDIYLIGAMLWEVVTGRPPHPGLLAAMRNTIRETDKSGELIDIARKAMATNMKDRHAQVREFQDEVRDYLDHSESLSLAAKSKADLEQAEKSGDYNEFSKAVFGFEQAKDLWAGNKAAVDGVYDAKYAYAKNAHEKADYDLALSLLSPDREEHAELRTKILHDQHERDARQGRLKLAKRAMMAMAACFLVVVSIGFVVIRAEKEEAVKQRGIVEHQKVELEVAMVDVREQKDKAEKAREEAVEAEKLAVAAKEKEANEREKAVAAEKAAVIAQNEAVKANNNLQVALKDVREEKDKAEIAREKAVAAEMTAVAAQVKEANERKKAVAAEKKAVEAKDKLQVALNEVQKQKEIADEKTVEALAAEKKAVESKEVAEQAKEAEEYEAYVARIGLAAAKIEENSFDVAKKLLKDCPEEHQNWEWGRLWHLCSFDEDSLKTNGPVDAVSISPDGKFLLSGSWDKTARVWDLKTRKLLHELPQEGDYVHSVAWSPDQKLIATAGSDASGRIRLWTAGSGELISKFNGHTEPVVSVVFSPNGEWLLTCSYDETARIWNIKNPENPEEVQVLEGHSWWVWDGAFSPDFDPANKQLANRIVTVSQDGKAIVWKMKTTAQRPQVTTVSLVQDKVSLNKSSTIEMVQESTFTGHRGPIYSVAYSPDGTEIATASNDKRVLLWNPADVPAFNLDNLLLKKTVQIDQRVLSGHSAPVQAVTYSRDGKLLISGGRDNAVKIWDLKNGKSIKTFRGHDSAVRSVDISPDGRQVISGAKDERIILWNVNEYEELRVLNGNELVGHEDVILGATFSSDGKKLLTAGRDRTARLWDADSGKSIRVFEEGHDFLTSKGLFLQGGRILATSAADNSVRLWNVETGTQMLRIPDTGRAALIAASPNEKWLVTGYEPKDNNADTNGKKWSVLVWNVADLVKASQEKGTSLDLKAYAKPIELREHYNRITAIAFAPEDNRLITCDYQGRSILWDLDQQTSLWSERHHQRSVTDCEFSPDGKTIYLSSTDRTISRVNAATGQEDRDSILEHPSGVSTLQISPDGKQLASVCLLESDLLNPGSLVKLWDLKTNEEILNIESTAFAINDLQFSFEGDHAIVVCNDNAVRILNFKANENSQTIGEPILDFEKLGGLVWSASFTEDRNSILTVGGSEARIWDKHTYREEMSFSPHGAVAAADFSPDGQLIVTGSWDNSAKIWDVNTGHAVRKLIGGHSGYINSTVFSPDGRHILTGSDDMTAKLWDISTGEVVQTYQGHEGRVRQATFSPDGTKVLTVSNDESARIWNTKSGQQIGEPFRQHDWAVLCGAFSPDGKRIITGSEDNLVLLWDIETRSEPIIFEGHTAAISAVCFSEDGSRIFTASQDNSAKIWDATPGREGAEILTLTEQEQELTSIAVSPDGNQIVTGSRDGTAVIWLTSKWGEIESKEAEIGEPIQ